MEIRNVLKNENGKIIRYAVINSSYVFGLDYEFERIIEFKVVTLEGKLYYKYLNDLYHPTPNGSRMIKANLKSNSEFVRGIVRESIPNNAIGRNIKTGEVIYVNDKQLSLEEKINQLPVEEWYDSDELSRW